MDLARIGEVAAELMDALEADADGGPDGVEVGVVAVIVELQTRDLTTIRYRRSDSRQWIQRALLREALEIAEDDESERADPGDD